jgi:hypothetical protein
MASTVFGAPSSARGDGHFASGGMDYVFASDFSEWQYPPTSSSSNSLRENNPATCLMEFYMMTDRGRDLSPDAPLPDFGNPAEADLEFGEVLTDAKLLRVIKNFQNSMNPMQNIAACACCNDRICCGTNNRKLRQLLITDACFELTAVSAPDWDKMEALQLALNFQYHTIFVPDWTRIDACRPPIAARKTKKVAGTKKATPADVAVLAGDASGGAILEPTTPTRPVAYRLYPSNVDSANGVVNLCKDCHNALTAKTAKKACLPKFSVANGFEFGNIADGTLPKLTVAEEKLLARHRTMCERIKVTPGGHNSLKGHVCLVKHTGPDAMEHSAQDLQASMTLPHLAILPSVVQVLFVGKRENWVKHLKKKQNDADATDSSTALLETLQHYVNVRPAVVFQWLRVLKLTNPAYKDVIIRNENDPDIIAALNAIPLSIIANAVVADDEMAIKLEEHTGNDVAGVRNVEEFGSRIGVTTTGGGNTTGSGVACACGGDSGAASEHPGSCVACTCCDAANTETASESASADEVVVDGPYEGPAILGAVYIYDPPQPDSDDVHFLKSVMKTVLVHRLGDDLINEYEEGFTAITNAFPHLFIFGTATFPEEYLFTIKFTSKLVNHASNRFVDQRLLFLLTNLIHRHSSSAIIGIKARTKPECMTKFGSITNAPEFTQRIQRAVKYPKSADAKALVKELQPLIRQCSAEVPFSAESRGAVLGRQMALLQLFGTPGFFITISPTDTNSALVMRFCEPVPEYHHSAVPDAKFPSSHDEPPPGFREHCRVNFVMPEHAERLRAVSDNPVAAAKYYGMAVHALFKHLLCLKPSHRQRRTTLPCDRFDGLFGRSLAYMGVTEVIIFKSLLHCNNNYYIFAL